MDENTARQLIEMAGLTGETTKDGDHYVHEYTYNPSIWHGWTGLGALPPYENILFRVIRYNPAADVTTHYVDWGFCGTFDGKPCIMTRGNGRLRIIDEDGTFDGGRITHWMFIPEP